MQLGSLALQATLVIGVTSAVGYPQFRQPARPVTVWRTAGPLTPRPDLVESDRRFAYGVARASAVLRDGRDPSDTGGSGFAADRPGERPALSSRLNQISGRARTSLNQPIPFATLLLRNLRTGRVESRIRADQSGQFQFDTLTSGAYVVELLGVDGAVLAAGEFAGSGGGEGTVRVAANATARALFGSTGTTTGTTTGTSSVGSTSNGTGFFSSTASEPLGQAAGQGIGQTTQPDEEASPRN